jgi:hypothetical protein
MAKSYQFIISACEAEKKYSDCNMLSYLPFSSILVENFEGTLDEALNQIIATKNKVISTNNFDSNKGFRIDLTLKHGQRKPAGYDSKRKQIENYYIA